jgi:hypothetical protein
MGGRGVACWMKERLARNCPRWLYTSDFGSWTVGGIKVADVFFRDWGYVVGGGSFCTSAWTDLDCVDKMRLSDLELSMVQLHCPAFNIGCLCYVLYLADQLSLPALITLWRLTGLYACGRTDWLVSWNRTSYGQHASSRMERSRAGRT